MDKREEKKFRIFELQQILSHIRVQLHNFISYTKILKEFDKICMKFEVFNQRQFMINHYSDEVFSWISGLTTKINNLIFGEIDILFKKMLKGFGENEKEKTEEFENSYNKIIEDIFEDNADFGFLSKENILSKKFKDNFIKKIENLIYSLLIKNQPLVVENEHRFTGLQTLENVLRKQIENEIENIEIIDQDQRKSLSLRYKSPTPQKKVKKIEKIVKVNQFIQKFDISSWASKVKISVEELPAPALDLHGISFAYIGNSYTLITKDESNQILKYHYRGKNKLKNEIITIPSQLTQSFYVKKRDILVASEIIEDFDRFYEPYVYRGIKVIGSSLSYIQKKSILKVIPELTFTKLENQNLILKINIPFEDKIYDHQILKNEGIVFVGSEGGYLYTFSMSSGDMINSVWIDCKRLWGFDLLKYQNSDLETKDSKLQMRERQFLTPTRSSEIEDFKEGGGTSNIKETMKRDDELGIEFYQLKNEFKENIYGVVSIQDQSKNTVVQTFSIDESKKIKILQIWKKRLEVQFSEIKLGIVVNGYPVVVAASEKGPSKIYSFVLEKNGILHEIQDDIFGPFKADYGFLFSSVVCRDTGSLITGGNSEGIVCMRFLEEGAEEKFMVEDEDELEFIRDFNHNYDDDEFGYGNEDDRLIFNNDGNERFYV